MPAPSSTHAGSVRTQASTTLRSVFICKPEWFAAMVPAFLRDITLFLPHRNPGNGLGVILGQSLFHRSDDVNSLTRGADR